MRWLSDKHLPQQLPLPLRLWAAYLRYAPRRQAGGAFGGSFAYRIARRTLRSNAGDGACLLRLQHPDAKFCIVVNGRDFEVFNHTIDLWLYGSSESRLLARLMSADAVFFDVGANYGLYALMAATTSGDRAQVYAFEPQPALSRSLVASLKFNRLENVVVTRAAVSSISGKLTFFVPRTGSGVGSILRDYAAQQSETDAVEVAAVTLDDFARTNAISRVDIMKIDVEGAELDVLQGAASFLRNYQPIVWFEVNPPALVAAGREAADLFAAFQRCGYATFYDVEALDSAALAAIDPSAAVSRLINVVAVPERLQGTFSSAHELSAGRAGAQPKGSQIDLPKAPVGLTPGR